MEKELPILEMILKSEEDGVYAISFVKKPAVQRDFVTLSNVVKLYKVDDEEKRIVSGALLIPDQKIYRRDEENGEYYIFYSSDTIKQVAQRIIEKNSSNNNNLEHSKDTDGARMVELFLKDSKRGINPTGFEDLPDNTLFASYKIEDDKLWNDIKSGVYNGFSIEGWFEAVKVDMCENEEININLLLDKLSEMSKINLTLSQRYRFGKLNTKFSEEVKLASTDTEQGQLLYDGELGDGTQVIFIPSGTGEEIENYTGQVTTDSKIIDIENGVVTSYRDKEMMSEEGAAEAAGEQEETLTEAEILASELYEKLQEANAENERIQAELDSTNAENAELKSQIEELSKQPKGQRLSAIQADEVVKNDNVSVSEHLYNQAMKLFKNNK